MSNQGQAEGTNVVSEESEVHDEESVKQIRQVFDNIEIVRRVYHARQENTEETRQYFYEKIGKQHEKFIDVLIEFVVETDMYYTKTA